MIIDEFDMDTAEAEHFDEVYLFGHGQDPRRLRARVEQRELAAKGASMAPKAAAKTELVSLRVYRLPSRKPDKKLDAIPVFVAATDSLADLRIAVLTYADKAVAADGKGACPKFLVENEFSIYLDEGVTRVRREDEGGAGFAGQAILARACLVPDSDVPQQVETKTYTEVASETLGSASTMAASTVTEMKFCSH